MKDREPKPTPEDVRQITREHFGNEIYATDEELQKDIDDFFNHEAAAKYEKENPEEIARLRVMLRHGIWMDGINSIDMRN